MTDSVIPTLVVQASLGMAGAILSEASLSFLNAHNANPGRADYSYNLAVSLERLGDYESAEFYFERAILSAGNNDDFNADEVRQHIGELAAVSREAS